MTMVGARRVLTPLLIVPAEASAPRMKLTGPDAVPPPFRPSNDDRRLERLIPDPDPPLKRVPPSPSQLRMKPIRSPPPRINPALAGAATLRRRMLNHTGK